MANIQDNFQMLLCTDSVKNYDWGRPAGDSQVARLFSLQSLHKPEPDKPYAEFWMGTHDSGPSLLMYDGDSEPLKSWLSKNPHVIGEKVHEKWGTDLPFLFKVLSVAKAVAKQVHPDLYKDAIDKPKMALAITEFEALCGFISLEELKFVLQTVPEIRDLANSGNALPVLRLTDQDSVEPVKREYTALFTQIMFADQYKASEAVGRLISRLTKESQERKLTDKEELALRIEEQYPRDIGVISSFLLNYVKLNPGEAISIGANEPHAYISGECIECTATSDSVVRAGLTYKRGPPEILRGTAVNPYVTKYLPPFDEFEIDRCVLSTGEATTFPAVPGPSIFLVLNNQALIQFGEFDKVQIVTEGDVIFAAAYTEVCIRDATDLILYRAGVNTKFFQSFQKFKKAFYQPS